jgi:hypothetical protein
MIFLAPLKLIGKKYKHHKEASDKPPRLLARAETSGQVRKEMGIQTLSITALAKKGLP